MERKIILFLLLSAKSVFSSNILFAALMPSPSHHIYNRILALELTFRGHNVTLIGPDEDEPSKVVNYSHMLLEGVYSAIEENFDQNTLTKFGVISTLLEFHEYSFLSCEAGLKSQDLRKLLNYPSDFKFDLIIFDVTLDACLYPLMQRFGYPPSIGITAFLLAPYVSFNFGNHLHPAYIPWYGLPYKAEMTFTERVWNFICTYVDVGWRYMSLYRKEHEAAKKIFGENLPSMAEFERNLSLVLTNIDPLLYYPQPLAPNFIPVGGLHTRPSKKLPEDMQSILNHSKDGIIVFSLGTNIRSDKLDKHVQKAFLDAFRQIPETVIWKYESEINNLPKNVIVRKWLLQNDIMGQPNVKLFIGHCGALSLQEAIFHGVPIICIPFFMDQHINAHVVVDRKLGDSIDLRRITKDYFLTKLREVIHNPIYTNNICKISHMFRDRSETPLERAIFWIEYVIRHDGADFLNTPTRDLPFFKASGLDVVIFLTVVTAIILLACYRLIKFVLKSCHIKRKVKLN